MKFVLQELRIHLVLTKEKTKSERSNSKSWSFRLNIFLCRSWLTPKEVRGSESVYLISLFSKFWSKTEWSVVLSVTLNLWKLLGRWCDISQWRSMRLYIFFLFNWLNSATLGMTNLFLSFFGISRFNWELGRISPLLYFNVVLNHESDQKLEYSCMWFMSILIFCFANHFIQIWDSIFGFIWNYNPFNL